MSSFAWIGYYCANIDTFRRYLGTLSRPTWARGVTIHHTWSPTEEQWRGSASMRALERYYRFEVRNTDGTRGWPAGPHVFNAPDGIWIGTPPNQPGVHAGVYNSVFWGIETVGNYDTHPFSPETRARLYGVIVALFQWCGINVVNMDTVRGHRECNSPKTCPGRANDMNQIRTELAEALHLATIPPPLIRRYRIMSNDGWAAVRIAPDIKAPRALNGTAKLNTGTIVDIDVFHGDWGHLAISNSFGDLGFVHTSLLQAIG